MKWVIFDAYGTLFNAGKFNIKMIAEEIADRYKVDSRLVYDMWTSRYVEQENDARRGFRTITETNRESLSFVFDTFELKDNYEYYVQRMNDEWSNPKLIEGVSDLMGWLRKQKCRIGIVSNSDDITLTAAIKNSGLYIDDFISSEMAKAYKPSSDIFKYALKKWNCVPAQCIYV